MIPSRTLLLVLLLLGMAAPVLGLVPPCRIVMQQLDFRGFPAVKAYFSLLDAKDKSIMGLKAADFRLAEDSVNVKDFKIRPVSEGNDPLAVVLVLDSSGSMQGEPIIRAQEAAIAFLERLYPKDQASVVSFDENVRVRAEFTTDRAQLKKAIKEISVVGNTALYDALNKAQQLLKASVLDRKAIVVLTDGRENSSLISEPEILKQCKEAGVPVYTIGLGPDISEDVLKTMASNSGGHYSHAPTANDLFALYLQVAEELNSQYLLEFTSPSGRDKKVHVMRLAADLPGQDVFYEINYIGIDHIPQPPPNHQRPTRVWLFGLGAGGLAGLLLGGIVFAVLRRQGRRLSIGRTVSVFGLFLVLGLIIGGIIAALGNAGLVPMDFVDSIMP